MRKAMETKEWNVTGSCYSQADPAQQFNLNLGKVWELESGKWGCEIPFILTGVWTIILKAQKASGQKQSITVENGLPFGVLEE